MPRFSLRRRWFVVGSLSLALALSLASPRDVLAEGVAEAKIARVLPAGQRPDDARLGPPRKLGDAYHPWTPPTTRAAWEAEAAALRERVLVATGLWPLPPKTPLNPVIHGRIDRDEYTIEKVFFESLPGHFVTGNLYRPKNQAGKRPGVLNPHGHWPNGRFFEGTENVVKDQVAAGAEQFATGAKYPLQARMVQLARMGCVVFHYDMVGYADSDLVKHREGFNDVAADLRLQNPMGLQTWNSIRALDFLLSLPDVDADRVGVTGSSGGGTQTFMLTAVDPRPHAAFPAVMVSTGMQGGCVCENCDYLRIGNNNIALAALFAPKPMAMSAAKDWTIDIETKGLPELKQVYGLYGAPDLVHARCFPQFGHNYNQVAREVMYDWFNAHLKLGLPTSIRERDFTPVSPADLSVYDGEHPRPASGKSVDSLRESLTKIAAKQFDDLLIGAEKNGPQEYRRVVGTAARVMLDAGTVAKDDVESKFEKSPLGPGLTLFKGTVGRRGAREQVPVLWIEPAKANGTVVLWLNGVGKGHLFEADGKIAPDVQRLLDAGRTVASADVFRTGEFLDPDGENPTPAVDKNFAGYTFGYNRPLLSNRVRDVVTVTALLANQPGTKSIELVGTGDAGLWTLLARAVSGANAKLGRTLVDLNGFSFGSIDSTSHPHMLPGALKYGDVGGLAALAAPGTLVVHRAPDAEWSSATRIFAATKGTLATRSEPLSRKQVADDLTR